MIPKNKHLYAILDITFGEKKQQCCYLRILLTTCIYISSSIHLQCVCVPYSAVDFSASLTELRWAVWLSLYNCTVHLYSHSRSEVRFQGKRGNFGVTSTTLANLVFSIGRRKIVRYGYDTIEERKCRKNTDFLLLCENRTVVTSTDGVRT